jgi:predicted TIM-barrel fold metal-dependent hydrolase
MQNSHLHTSRRTLLQALTAGATATFIYKTTPAANPRPQRIDVHGHFMSPAMIDAIGASELGLFANWSATKHIDSMNENGIASSLLSIPPHYDPELVDRLARPTNEFGAQLAGDHPGRFGLMAFLPMPHIDITLREIEHALDTLKADGVAMYTNYGDKWLGDATFDPVFAELNRRSATLFVHPISANCCKSLLPNIADTTIEWQTDTTRAIANLLFSGTTTRYPNVRIIFSHGGGTMPYLVERFTAAASNIKYKEYFPHGFTGALNNMFFDTAWTSNTVAMGALRQVVPLTHILLGSDYPARSLVDHVKGLQECGVFTASELKQIERENALTLFPRFRT